MASSDDEEWEQAPEEEDSEDADFVPEAPPAPDPAAIREAYAREQAQAPRAAPQKGSEPDPDDETLDDLRAKAAANQEEAAPPAPAPATTDGTATNGAAAPATTADAAYSFVELPAPQHKEASGDLAPRLRRGLASVLQTYVINVDATALVESPDYESIVIVDANADLSGADLAGQVKGGCCYRVWPTVDGKRRFIELALIAVRHERQGRGVGAALMRRLKQRALRERGAQRIVTYADERAFAYFRRLGFSRTVTLPFREWKGRIVDYGNGAVVAELRADVTDPSASARVARQQMGGRATSQQLATGVTRCTSGRPNCYCKSGRTRAIVRYDPETGEDLEEYCSTSDAARKLNLRGPSITHVLSGTTEDADGHKFRYKVEVPWVRSGGPKAVQEVNPATGAVIREFTSATHAARVTGFSNGTIGQVCNGKVDSVDGRVFRFRDLRALPCSVCGSDGEANSLLLCDGMSGRCPSTAHFRCVGLDKVPEGDWFCASCQANGGKSRAVHVQARKRSTEPGARKSSRPKKRVAVDAGPQEIRKSARPRKATTFGDEVVTPPGLPPPRELVVSDEQAADERRKAQMDGWTTVGSEYLGRTVRRTILDAAGRPVSCSDGIIRGWLDAATSDYVDSSGQPAALWHAYLSTGELAGDEIDLELYEVLESLVPVQPKVEEHPETARARADGWRVEGSEYLGRTVRRTVLDASGLVTSHSDGVIRGWLDASRSDYVDDNGKPAALWHVYLATGELAGDEIDLELHEVLDSLVPATPTADASAARRRQEESDAALARALAEADADAPPAPAPAPRKPPSPRPEPERPRSPRAVQWSLAEERVIRAAQAELGNKWAEIAKRLPGKTDNDVKNYWYSQSRKAERSGSPRGVLPPLPSPPPAHLPHIGCKQAGWVAACTELLAVVKERSGIMGLRDRLRSAGFRCGKPVGGKTYYDISVPLTFPCCYDVAGKNYAANQDVLRSKPQLVKYLEGCLALAREEASYRTESEREADADEDARRAAAGVQDSRRPSAAAPPAAEVEEVPRTSPSPAPTSEPPSPPENDEPKRRRAAPGLSYAEYDDDVDMDRPPTPAEDVDLARAIAASKADMAAPAPPPPDEEEEAALECVPRTAPKPASAPAPAPAPREFPEDYSDVFGPTAPVAVVSEEMS